MLDKKDKIIFENLLQDSRISTIQLAKLTRLAQSSVVYRIQKLEESHISKYDALVNFSKLNIPIKFYFISNNDTKFNNYLKRNKTITSHFSLLNKKNHFVLSIDTNYNQTSFESYLNKRKLNFESFKLVNMEILNYSLFTDVKVKNPRRKIVDKDLKLDQIDYKLISKFMNGGGRKSILEISQETKLSYDIVLYRFKRLVKHGYFALFIAQPNQETFKLNVDMIKFRAKPNLKKYKQILERTKRCPYIAECEDGVYITQILSTSYQEYKAIIKEILDALKDDIEEFEIFNTDKVHILNRLRILES